MCPPGGDLNLDTKSKLWRFPVDLIFNISHLILIMHVFIFVLVAAVKVQKSNHHHWDQSSNYCHPPHVGHSKTWSSPSHPHNQQDHCKCKLSLVTALLLAGPFFWLFNSPIIKTSLHDYPNNSHTLFHFFAPFYWCDDYFFFCIIFFLLLYQPLCCSVLF